MMRLTVVRWRRSAMAARSCARSPVAITRRSSGEHIIANIAQARRPVIVFGVVGPPEAAIITGYDAGGDVLIGWSFFQGMPEFAAGLAFEPSGTFRKRDWFEHTESLVIIRRKG